jgi:hypothetical protein
MSIFENEAGRRSTANDEAFLVAVNFAELPSVPRQIYSEAAKIDQPR